MQIQRHYQQKRSRERRAPIPLWHHSKRRCNLIWALQVQWGYPSSEINRCWLLGRPAIVSLVLWYQNSGVQQVKRDEDSTCNPKFWSSHYMELLMHFGKFGGYGEDANIYSSILLQSWFNRTKWNFKMILHSTGQPRSRCNAVLAKVMFFFPRCISPT